MNKTERELKDGEKVKKSKREEQKRITKLERQEGPCLCIFQKISLYNLFNFSVSGDSKQKKKSDKKSGTLTTTGEGGG